MKPNVVERAWRWLARPDLFAWLIIALLAVVLLGTLVPQTPAAAPGSDQLAEWHALALARFGPLASFLRAAGAFRVYRSPLLWVPLALATAATLACTVQRAPRSWQAAFDQPVRLDGTALDAAPHTATIDAPPSHDASGLDALSGLARRALAERGYRTRGERTPEALWVRGDRNRLSPVSRLAEHVAVLLLLVGVGLGALLGWKDAFAIEPGGTAAVGHGSGIALHNDGFEIQRYGDGSPAAYVARVIIETDRQAEPRQIGVNQPAVARGVRIYLQGYRQVDDRYAITLMAARDPGYPFVIGGGVLFIASIVVSIFFPRSIVRIRITGDGMLRLTGWADRRADGFGREFAGLVAELQRGAGDA